MKERDVPPMSSIRVEFPGCSVEASQLGGASTAELPALPSSALLSPASCGLAEPASAPLGVEPPELELGLPVEAESPPVLDCAELLAILPLVVLPLVVVAVDPPIDAPIAVMLPLEVDVAAPAPGLPPAELPVGESFAWELPVVEIPVAELVPAEFPEVPAELAALADWRGSEVPWVAGSEPQATRVTATPIRFLGGDMKGP